MNAPRLLRRLRDAGFKVQRDENELVVLPRSNLTSFISSRIEEHKTELLTLLAGSDPTPDETVECIDCGVMLPLSGVRCPSTCRDAHPEPTCASCGADIDDADLIVCHLCAVEDRVGKMQEDERRVA